ncbi:MAG: hypothetical protein ACLR23_14040 [Clostridia bacterium]
METIVFQEQGAHFDGQLDEEPDWKAFGENLHEWFDGYDAAAIVEINAMKDNAAIEKRQNNWWRRRWRFQWSAAMSYFPISTASSAAPVRCSTPG